MFLKTRNLHKLVHVSVHFIKITTKLQCMVFYYLFHVCPLEAPSSKSTCWRHYLLVATNYVKTGGWDIQDEQKTVCWMQIIFSAVQQIILQVRQNNFKHMENLPVVTYSDNRCHGAAAGSVRRPTMRKGHTKQHFEALQMNKCLTVGKVVIARERKAEGILLNNSSISLLKQFLCFIIFALRKTLNIGCIFFISYHLFFVNMLKGKQKNFVHTFPYYSHIIMPQFPLQMGLIPSWHGLTC